MGSKSGYKYIRWLNQIGEDDIEVVGGKAANLAKLLDNDINCPLGFCVTSQAFDLFVGTYGFRKQINHILSDVTKPSVECANEIQGMLSIARLPETVRVELVTAYHEMGEQLGNNIPMAVRSSALVEDSKGNSFAGQFDSYLGLIGEQQIISSILRCWSSLFNARSIAYSRRRKVSPNALSMAVVVQKLVRATQAGVMFTIHPLTFDPNQMIIEATLGLGEQLVSGRVSPDTFVVNKMDYSIIQSKIVEKRTSLVFDGTTSDLENKLIDNATQLLPALTDFQVSELAKIGIQIEVNFNGPQDIEWVIENNDIYIVQSRPMTVLNKLER